MLSIRNTIFFTEMADLYNSYCAACGNGCVFSAIVLEFSDNTQTRNTLGGQVRRNRSRKKGIRHSTDTTVNLF